MKIKSILFYISLYFVAINSAYSAEGNSSLEVSLKIKPSCVVNGQSYQNNDAGISFGTIDFGVTGTRFNTIQSTLSGAASGGGISFNCASGTPIRLIFGSGQNDSKVPSENNGLYFRALKSADNYIAYNIYSANGSNVLKPNDNINLTSTGQLDVVGISARVVGRNGIIKGDYTDSINVTIEF